MHTQQKERLIKLIDTAKKLQEMLLQVTTIDDRIAVLTKCQEVAISVGETLENSGEDDNGIVHLLEEYCEMIFAISQLEEVVKEDIRDVQDKLLQVRERLEELPTKYRVVFLPYKADMWDSLESIWRECVKDSRCECDVVPIPYFELNREEKKWEPHYDGPRFPADVPIIHYDYYRMDEMQPDVAYIHNPYDDCNHVTTVHPYYYSNELKKNVKKLVYVPYYANAGFIAPDQQALPVCRNMDYMVAQSETAKETCVGSYFYNKILPFGSPKFDKVIKKSQNGVEIPAEWQPVIYGKKVLMLNTTINDLLNFNEVLLTKLKYFFELIKANDDVALIWRPHPLLEATIKSLRPHMMEQYKELMEFFKENEVGILDLTGDVSNTVAIADAYVGSSYSSVINLFGVAGKPIFLFDNLIYKEFDEAERRLVILEDAVKTEYDVTAITQVGGNVLNVGPGNCRLVSVIEDECRWNGTFWSMAEHAGKMYLAPLLAEHAVEYDLKSGQCVKLNDEGRERGGMFTKVINAGNKLYYLAFNDFLMMEYEIDSGTWKYHTECIKKLWAGSKFQTGMWRTRSGAVYGDSLWVTTGGNHRVLEVNVNDGSYKIHYIGDSSRWYAVVVADADGLWLTDSFTGDIIRWYYGMNGHETYVMPEEFECWNNVHGVMQAHIGLIDMGEYLVTVPGHANYMVRINKATKEADLLARNFWENASAATNGFHATYQYVGGVAVKIDETHIMMQRRCDAMMAVIDVEQDTFETFVPELSDEDFAKLMDGEDGFEKAGKRDYFCRRESRIFTIQGFIDDLISGRLEAVRERQLEELSTLAANLDGTCGQKVHEYMMNVLESED